MDYSVPRNVLDARREVFPYRFGEETAFVKKLRRPKNPLGWYAQRCLYRLTGNFLLAPPRRSGVDNITLEVGKLRRLARLGVPVPRVLHVAKDYFVLSDAGATLEDLLREEPEKRDDAVGKGAAALRRLHDLGEAHGGAQIKNLTWRDGDVGFIDFEEDVPEGMLAEFRLRDLYLFVASLERHGYDPDLRRVCGWYDPDGSRDALGGLCRALRGLRAARALENRLLAGLSMRDVRSLNRLIEKAGAALPRGDR